jgi:hypothetical protein
MPITNITAMILTYDVEDAGTDGNVYLGICGREFRCDSAKDDFERGSTGVYKFGDTPGYVTHPDANDPRNPRLDQSELDLYPVYLRFDQGSSDHWALELVKVWINDPIMSHPHHYERQFFPNAPLWMGKNAGNFCYLHKVREVPGFTASLQTPP